MFELPLFPLSSVLFPGMTNSLYIFEERYKAMINRCLEHDEPFGWVLIAEGREALGPVARPYRVGCTAQIARVQPLEQGTMNIMILGEERFEIKALQYDQSYLVGTVETYPISNNDPENLEQQETRLRPLVERYLSVLAKTEEMDFDPQQLPEDPVELAYLSAAILQQLPAEKKQHLLAAPSAVHLLQDIYTIYHREVTILDMMVDRSKKTADEPFSLN
ncbi:MAG: LON peptidase substrate-binding domain-containing protein [Anaerolineae bacterium]|nr:LON peptidase substrate-binding domain-containing protein [Anaerolineae bacterium]